MDFVHVKEKWTSFIRPRSHLSLESPVPHLLTYNDTPSDEEKRLIQQALRAVEKQRIELLREMECRAIWELVESKSQVTPPGLKLIEEHLIGLKGILSPMRRVPPELLQEIFLCGFREGSEMRKHPSKTAPGYQCTMGDIHWPWTLSQVCRQWRQTSLATPSLWTRLPVLEIKKKERYKEQIRKKGLYALMIERSQEAPLDVFVAALYSYATAHPILEMLVGESNRWGNVVLELDWSTFNTLFKPIKNRLQLMRRLRFHLDCTYERAVPAIWETFSDTPCLQHVDIQVHLTGNRVDAHIPFPRALHDLINSPNLCSLVLAMSPGIYDAPISSITLPRLTRLKLTYYNSPSPFTVLGAIIAPVLDELVVVGDSPSGQSQNLISHVQALIKRSFAPTMCAIPLTKLHLQMTSVQSDILVHIVDSLPNLIVLGVLLHSNTLELLSRLSSTDPTSVIAPHLEFCMIQAPAVPFDNAPDLFSAVNKLADARCCEDLLDPTRLDTKPFKRLKALTLWCAYHSATMLPSLHRMLEECGLPQQNRQHKSASSTLLELKISAIVQPDHTSQLNSYYVHHSPWLTPRSALGMLQALKKYYTVDDIDARDIYIPRVHIQLQILDKWIEDNVAQKKWKSMSNILRDLQNVIRDTLEKWYFILDEHSAQIRWVAISRRILMYVPADHPIRFTSESINLARVGEAPSNLSPFYELALEGVPDDL